MVADLNYFNGCKALEENKVDLAISYFTKALEQNPDNLKALEKRLDAFFANDDHVNAAKDIFLQSKLYTRRIHLNPTDESLYIKRGECYRLLLHEKKAAADFKNAIKLNPLSADAHIQMGILANGSEALKWYIKAEALEKENSQVLFYMANVYNQLNNIDKAEEYYLKCIKTNEGYDVAAYRALSRLYAKQEQYEKAIAISKELLSKYDGFDSDYSRLAEFFKKTGEVDEALTCLNAAIAADPLRADNYYELAQFYYETQKFELALENINRAFERTNQASERVLRKSILMLKTKCLIKLNRSDELEDAVDEVFQRWRSEVQCLKKLARSKGLTMNEIESYCYKHEA